MAALMDPCDAVLAQMELCLDPAFLADLQSVQDILGAMCAPSKKCTGFVGGEENPGSDILWSQRRAIVKLLTQQNVPIVVTELRENEYSLPGQPLYERFLNAWCECPDKSIRLVFHGTPAANVDSILRESLDPSRRRGQAMGPGEYFGELTPISEQDNPLDRNILCLKKIKFFRT